MEPEANREPASLEENTATMRIVESTVQALWAAVNELSRIRPHHARYRVTIFGSSRVKTGDPVYAEVRWLSQRLAERGCDIVTGGGPGLMQAANEGEHLGDPANRTSSLGIRVDLPFEQGTNPFVEKAYTHRTFFTRLHHFVRVSDAFVVFPGGIGTTLELLMVWQLLQVKQVTGVPLIVVGSMWEELVAWARRSMIVGERHFADPDQIDIPLCVENAAAAAALIEERLRERAEAQGTGARG